MPPPRGGGALYSHLNDASHASTPHSQGGVHATQNSANNGANLTPQEQLLAGTGLGLDPKNDPVVFTTDYGLEIKSHNADGVPDISNVDTNQDASITVSSTSWNYISAGGYNWIIIGSYSESSHTISTLTVPQYQAIGGSSLADGTPAGTAVKDEDSKQVIKINDVTVPAFLNAKTGYNGEIPFGCVLCLCEENITTTTFNPSTSSGNNYSGSDLEDYMNNTVYGSTSTLSTALQALPIVPQKLTTLYSGNEPSIIENAYVFPLAGRSNTESFYVESYLDTDAKRDIDATWWLRSGNAPYSIYAYFVYTDGDVLSSNSVHILLDRSAGVRPAFVLRLYSA
ncbi:MAG: hypothetical protein IKK20_02265 [Clostridia bacterium]|nr:hypothetical protein [Clostridia bacterium]